MGKSKIDSSQYIPNTYKKTEGRIEEILKDKSFPRVILLDGEWGSGKTYFLRDYYLKINSKKIVYVSMLGVNNLKSFMDKVYTAVVFKEKSKIAESATQISASFEELVKRVANLAADGSGDLVEYASSLGAIAFNFLASRKLKGKVLIVDDIERVDFNSFKLIAGELFTLADDVEMNFSIIFVGNTLRIKDNVSEDKAIINSEVDDNSNNTSPLLRNEDVSNFMEKIVVYNVNFYLDEGDVVSIFCKYLVERTGLEVSDREKEKIKEVVSQSSSKNIRILKRIAHHYGCIKEYLKNQDSYEDNDSYYSDFLDHALSCIYKVLYAYFTLGVIGFEKRVRDFFGKDILSSKDENLKTMFRFKLDSPTLEFTLFFALGIGTLSEAVDSIQRAVNTPLGKMLSFGIDKLDQETFDNAVKEMECYISNKKLTSPRDWFVLVYYYKRFVDGRCIENKVLVGNYLEGLSLSSFGDQEDFIKFRISDETFSVEMNEKFKKIMKEKNEQHRMGIVRQISELFVSPDSNLSLTPDNFDYYPDLIGSLKESDYDQISRNWRLNDYNIFVDYLENFQGGNYPECYIPIQNLDRMVCSLDSIFGPYSTGLNVAGFIRLKEKVEEMKEGHGKKVSEILKNFTQAGIDFDPNYRYFYYYPDVINSLGESDCNNIVKNWKAKEYDSFKNYLEIHRKKFPIRNQVSVDSLNRMVNALDSIFRTNTSLDMEAFLGLKSHVEGMSNTP